MLDSELVLKKQTNSLERWKIFPRQDHCSPYFRKSHLAAKKISDGLVFFLPLAFGCPKRHICIHSKKSY